MFDNGVYLGGVHEGTLDTGYIAVGGVEHVASSNELLSALGIEYGAGVDDGLGAEGYTGRYVRLDNACNDVH